MDESPAAEVLRAKLRGDPAAPRSPGGPTLAKIMKMIEDSPKPAFLTVDEHTFSDLAYDMMVPATCQEIIVDGVTVVRASPQGTSTFKAQGRLTGYTSLPAGLSPLQPGDLSSDFNPSDGSFSRIVDRPPPELTMPQLFEVLHIAATHRDDRVRDAAITLLNRALRF